MSEPLRIMTQSGASTSECQNTFLQKTDPSDSQRIENIASETLEPSHIVNKGMKRPSNDSDYELESNKKQKFDGCTGNEEKNVYSMKKTLKKSKVKRTTAPGDEYQRLLQILVRNRSLKNPGSKIGIEVSDVGAMDDVVLLKQYNNCRFFQVKHSILPICNEHFFKNKFPPTNKSKNDTLKSPSDKSKNDTLKSPSDKSKNDTLKSPSDNSKSDTLKSPSDKSENDTLKFLSDNSKNDTLISPSDKSKNYSLESPSDKSKNDPLKSPSDQSKNDPLKSPSDKSKNDTLKSPSDKSKNDTLKSHDLHIMYYFESYCLIKSSNTYKDCNIEEMTFVTNRNFPEKTPKKSKYDGFLEEVNIEDDNVLCLKVKQAKKYRLNTELVAKCFEGPIKERYYTGEMSVFSEASREVIKEFLCYVRIIINFPDIPTLKKIIFEEIRNERLTDFDVEDILHSFVMDIEIKLLTEEGDGFLTNEQWTSRIDQLKDSLTKIKITCVRDSDKRKLLWRVDDNDIEFESNAVSDMLNDIHSFWNDNDLNILHVCGVSDAELTAIKIRQVLTVFEDERDCVVKPKETILLSFESVLAADFVMESFIKNDSPLLLVFWANETIYSHIGNFTSTFQSALKMPKKKVIFISNLKNKIFFDDYFSTKLLEVHLKETCYSHGFKDLNSSSKEKLWNKEIIFQGKPVLLGKLLQNSHSFAEEVIDEDILWRILDQSNKLSVLNEEAFKSQGYNKEYYIPRKFEKRRVSYPTIKTEINDTLFYITGTYGMNSDSITSILKRENIQHCITEWQDCAITEDLTGVVLTGLWGESNEKLFIELTTKNKTVKWLRMDEKGDLFILDSSCKSSESTINKYDQYTDEQIHKSGFNQKPEKTVIVVGDSGEGKSTVLTHIANMLKEKDNSGFTWIIRVNLRRFCHTVTLKPVCTKEDYMHQVKEMVFSKQNTKFEKQLFIGGLKEPGRMKMVLLLDGFNEITKKNQGKICRLIDKLSSISNIHQCWVTTQPQDKLFLENKLNVVAYFLNKLELKEQSNLMAQYWKSKYLKKGIPVNEIELQKNADAALEKWMKCFIDEKERSFTSISLNLIMLADVLLDNHCMFDRDISLLELYDTFVQSKFLAYYRETSECLHCYKVPQFDDITKEKLFIRSIREVLQQISMEKVFNEYWSQNKIIHKTKTLPGMAALQEIRNYLGIQNQEILTSTLSKIGFLSSGSGDLDFSHSNYNQYFLNEFLVKNLKIGIVQEFLTTHVLTKKPLRLCRTFFNKVLMLNNPGSEQINNCSMYRIDMSTIRFNKVNKNKIEEINRILREEKHECILQFVQKIPIASEGNNQKLASDRTMNLDSIEL